MKLRKILLFVMLIAFTFLTLSTVKVSAATDSPTATSLLEVEGAQVRTSGTAGIRFVGKVSSDIKVEDVDAFGIAIAFGEASASEITVGATVNGKSVLTGQVATVDEDNKYYVNLINIPESMYGQKVTTRSYYLMDGVRYYSDTVTIRSLGQVTLGVKNAGQTSDLIEEIFTVLSTKYMKAYPVGEYYYINNAVYEYEPTVLAEYFLADYNEVMGTSLTTLVGYANNTRGKTYQDAGTKATIQANALYQFFNANDKEMVDKWGWLVAYICQVANNSYVTAQANYVTGATELTSSNASWWECRHFLARFEGFFTRAKVGTGFPNNDEFNDNSEYPGLITAINNLENKYLATGEHNLIYIGKEISTDLVQDEIGYELSSYTIGSTEYKVGEGYVVTSDPVVISPVFKPIEYTITYMYGDEEITELADTYTIEEEVTLPEYSFDVYDVGAWYESPTLDTEAVTAIAVGTTGNKVYYASVVPASYKAVDVVYDLNGGTFEKYNSYDDAVADFLKDFNEFFATQTSSYTGIEYTADTFYALGSYVQPIGQVTTFLYNDTYEAKWSWLVNYIATVAGSNNKAAFTNFYNYTKQSELIAANSNYIYCIAYEIRAWVGQAKYSQNSNFVTADYSSSTIQNDVLELVRGQIEYTYTEPTSLEVPSMTGSTFVGWESSVDGSVVTEYPGYYTNPGVVTYTAKWKYTDIKIGSQSYSSLSEAFAVAEDGDTINVPAGIYSEDVTIAQNNVTIQGANADIFGPDGRDEETIFKGVITVDGASGVTVNGCQFSYISQVSLTAGTSDFTFCYNNVTVLSDTSNDGIVCFGETGTVSNIKINYNYSSDFKSARFVRFVGNVNGLEMIGNEIIGNLAVNENPTDEDPNAIYIRRLYDFVHISGTLKGKVKINDNTFANANESFLYVKYVGVLDCEIKGNVISNIRNTGIDLRDMAENGAVSIVIENNVFNNVARGWNGIESDGWDVIRIRSNGYDSNDTLSINVNDNKFIDSYKTVDSAPRFIANPSYSTQSDPFKSIYTIGRNYYEIDGVAYTELTDASFGSAAISYGSAYATAEEVPGF